MKMNVQLHASTDLLLGEALYLHTEPEGGWSPPAGPDVSEKTNLFSLRRIEKRFLDRRVRSLVTMTTELTTPVTCCTYEI